MIEGKKNMWLFIGIVLVATVTGLFYFYKTQTVWIESPPYKRVSTANARALVVVYSRTGNTLGAAKEVARFFDADMLQIKAPQYARNMKGQMLASDDADKEVTTTPILHDPVNLSDYDLIFLCSPTWWFRPAPPLWSFVENHDFAKKSVFLLMTGNSRLTEERTGKFSTLVERKNGKYIDKLFIRRGRIYWQKSSDQIYKEIRTALKNRHNLWSDNKSSN